MNKKIYKAIPHVLAATAVFAAWTSCVFAANTSVTYAPLTTVPGLFKAGVATNPVAVIKGLYGLAIGAGSVIAVVMIVLAGFKYMYEESISGKSGAKEQIQNAFLGLLVILGSYILLRTVNADLVNFNPMLPGGTGNVGGLVAADLAAEAVRKANVGYQDQMTNVVAPLQKNIDTINTNLASINTSINDIQASTTLSVADKKAKVDNLQAAKTKATDELTTATAQLATARNKAEDARLSAVNQNAAYQLQTALAKGDNAAAQAVINRAKSVYETEIARRGNADFVSLTELQNNLATVEAQAVVSGATSNIVNNMVNRTDGYAPDYPTIARTRADLVAKTQATINTTKASDPATAAKLTSDLNTALASIDSAVAKKTGCKIYTSTPEGYQCTGN